MLMRVDETRQHRTAIEIDDLGRSGPGVHHGVRRADCNDAAVLDRERLDGATVAGHRNDRTAAEDEIGAVGRGGEGPPRQRRDRGRARGRRQELAPGDALAHRPERSEDVADASLTHAHLPKAHRRHPRPRLRARFQSLSDGFRLNSGSPTSGARAGACLSARGPQFSGAEPSLSRRYFTSRGPSARAYSFSCMTPSRRATSV